MTRDDVRAAARRETRWHERFAGLIGCKGPQRNSLVYVKGLTHLYVILTKRDVRHEVPDLTLDMALRVLRAAFAKPTLSDQEAIDLIDYHLERNRTAHESHRKTFLEKHERLKPEVLL